MSLKYLLDTDICIYIAKKRPPEVFKRFTECNRDEIGMSLITYGELRCGAKKSQHQEIALAKLDALKQHMSVLAMEPEVAVHYGDIRAQLEQSGIPIGNNDLWIAAHARALGVTVVTNNTDEFERIENLNVENWVLAEDKKH
jgi:tRNA(fMet)-specific endonuclease VapC